MVEDEFAFRNIDEKWPEFKREPHNLRLSLTSNGVKPFGEPISTYLV